VKPLVRLGADDVRGKVEQIPIAILVQCPNCAGIEEESPRRRVQAVNPFETDFRIARVCA